MGGTNYLVQTIHVVSGLYYSIILLLYLYSIEMHYVQQGFFVRTIFINSFVSIFNGFYAQCSARMLLHHYFTQLLLFIQVALSF